MISCYNITSPWNYRLRRNINQDNICLCCHISLRNITVFHYILVLPSAFQFTPHPDRCISKTFFVLLFSLILSKILSFFISKSYILTESNETFHLLGCDKRKHSLSQLPLCIEFPELCQVFTKVVRLQIFI